MTDVWFFDRSLSGLLDYPDSQPIAEKYFGFDWRVPGLTATAIPQNIVLLMNRHNWGENLLRDELAEAASIYDEAYDVRGSEHFIWIGGYMCVGGKMAEILSKADFGEGGGLVPIPFYKADKETLLEQEFFLLNFGHHNIRSFLPEQSRNVSKSMYGGSNWHNRSAKDGDIALSSEALSGPDIWIEKDFDVIFLKDWLAREILEREFTRPKLSIHKCRVVDAA